MTKKLLIGTSFSLCLGELVRGEVKLEDVDLILTSTTYPDLEAAVASEEKWAAPAHRIAILRAIWPKMIQPRLLHSACTGHVPRPNWIEAASLAEAFRMLDARDPMKGDSYEELGFVAWADVLLSTRIPVPIDPKYAHVVTPHAVDPGSYDRIKHGLFKLVAGDYSRPWTPAPVEKQ